MLSDSLSFINFLIGIDDSKQDRTLVRITMILVGYPEQISQILPPLGGLGAIFLKGIYDIIIVGA